MQHKNDDLFYITDKGKVPPPYKALEPELRAAIIAQAGT